MKILQICPIFPPSPLSYYGSGVITVVYHLSKELVRRGHEVTVYTSAALDTRRKMDHINNPVIVDGIEVHHFPYIIHYYTSFITLGIMPYMRKNIRNFDIIHLHDSRCFQGIIGHHYAKKYSIPYVLQAHGSVLPIFQKQRLKKIFDIFFGYRILRDASKVIALTKTEAEQYKKMGVDEDKIEIVPNGIDLSEYNSLPKRGEFRRKYKIGDDEKMILYIGRLHKSKGIKLLVKTFADVSKELDNVILVFVGPDDGYRSALNGIIKELKVYDKVLFTGFVNNEEKMAAFVDADVLVIPSFTGFPVTFLEACACGTPIITTNNGDKLDWIQDKVGYVVRYDKAILRDAIFKVLSDDGLSRKFGEEGRRLVREKFGWDEVVGRLEQIYGGIVS
jgi:glycosyltransferase involved in cell wall biosynthesis